MLNMLPQNIIYGRTHYAFEHIGAADDLSILILQVTERKGELNITQTVSIGAISEIKEHFSKVKSGHLLINNSQVLHKTVLSNTGDVDIQLLNRAFSNIDLDVFYYEIIRGVDKAFVFICRKQYVKDLLQEYLNEDIFITTWSLGVSSINSVVSILDGDGEITTISSTVIYSNGYIEKIDFKHQNQGGQSSYQIDELKVQGDRINALGGILRTFGGVDESRYFSNNKDDQEVSNTLFKQQRLYDIGLPIALIILLLVFFINFLFYNHYYQEVSVLGEVSESNSLQKELLIKKDAIVDQKQKLFEDVIESSSSSSSFYIDQVIQEMPETISLDRLQYHPLIKKIREGKSISLEKDIILISGISKVNRDISYWISVIENKDFVNKVFIKNLVNKGSNTLFTLELHTK
ncbi:hypothetical protein MED134_08451 [Dokdonia sp. MED134]|uniref:hypothetical protein n=1 Tax=Dokdonia sp. MED134 TaxID=313590 RepID=UPI000068CFDF|nr:hypothetical protein [Dokdonia sp. MED134]EAQ39507.1 hypothetical protein MED134_08451 [Dokdonia sp. MED134]